MRADGKAWYPITHKSPRIPFRNNHGRAINDGQAQFGMDCRHPSYRRRQIYFPAAIHPHRISRPRSQSVKSDYRDDVRHVHPLRLR